MLIVNMFGGPGSGKSTFAHGLMYWLKVRENVKVEFLPEPIKIKAYDKELHPDFTVQYTILGAYAKAFKRLENKVDIIVLDGSCLLPCIYSPSDGIAASCFEVYHTYSNVNFYVHRTKKYITEGRNETEEEAKSVDERTKIFLENHLLTYLNIETLSSHACLDTTRYLEELCQRN